MGELQGRGLRSRGRDRVTIAKGRSTPRIRVSRQGLPEAPLGPCRTGLPRPGEPITEQHLERALEIMAGIVVQHGEWAPPLYARLETERGAMHRQRQSFSPAGDTKRCNPPPSASLYPSSAGLALRIAISVNGFLDTRFSPDDTRSDTRF